MTELSLLTVAIPTFNRAFYVTTAVESLRAQANDSQRWRVIVVDNNSTDDTATRLQRISAVWPRLTVVREVKQGSSQARNRALEMCDDGWLLFADDEAKFPSDYIDRALRIMDERRPAIFGGPIYPWYPEPPPAWWRDDYGSFSLPWRAGRGGRIYLSGGNMGFDVEALRAVGGFDPDLGMHGGSMGFGEETAVELAIVARFGPERIWFDPDFINFHAVRPEKYRVRHMLVEHFRRGIARAQLQASAAREADHGPVPECLQPRPTPVQDQRSRSSCWQHLAIHYGLAVVRYTGQFWPKLRRLGR